MTEDQTPLQLSEETEDNILNERPIIKEDNKYNTRGCHCMPSLEDQTRERQMCCCAKLATFDWTKGLIKNDDISKYNVIEVRFKNSHKEFYRNAETTTILEVGNIVVVEAATGFDVGIITLTGPAAHLQYRKRQNVLPVDELRKVLRKARQNDVDKWNKTIDLEKDTQIKARRIANEQGLKMKINDVEYQGDGSKATFFYTADDRVDFRQLIKLYAEEFRVRIEMRQIGARQEAMHLGGIGSCGRELCCVTFLSNFHTVSTHTARVQQLSLNPQKLAGQCGKLKCCLNYEYEMYKEAAKDFPDPEIPLFFRKGKAIWHKTDVFARTMYYAYANEYNELTGLSVETVHEIIKLNQQKDFPETLEQFSKENGIKTVPNDESNEYFDNVVGQDELTRFDKKKSRPQHPQYHRSPRPPRDDRSNNRSEHPKPEKQNPNYSRSDNRPQRSENSTNRPVREISKPILKPKTNPDA
jgi:cell fate regulator YaaT (PSP1 superfamily)